MRGGRDFAVLIDDPHQKLSVHALGAHSPRHSSLATQAIAERAILLAVEDSRRLAARGTSASRT